MTHCLHRISWIFRECLCIARKNDQTSNQSPYHGMEHLERMDTVGDVMSSDHIVMLKDLIASHAALGDVHAAMNTGMRVIGRQRQSRQTAFALTFPFVFYVQGITRYCRTHDIQRVFFLSREGLFFKRLFDITGPSELESHYLCVSRIALMMLTIDELDNQTVDRVLDLFDHHSHLGNVSIRQLFYILKIDDKKTIEIIHELGHDENRLMPFREHRDFFKSLLLDERIKRVFVHKRSDYEALFRRYLHSCRVPENGRILLCDMGWSGSMQTYLADIFSKQGYRVQLHGFYFGYDKTIDASKHKGLSEHTFKTGYFTNDGTETCLQEKQIINNLFLEVLCSAGHGTVVGYRDQKKGVSPEFKNIPEEIWQYLRFIRPFQKLILEYARYYASTFDEIARVYSQEERYVYNKSITHDLFFKPSRELQRFLAFIFYDDFFGQNVRILLAPYQTPNWRLRIRFGIRGIACWLTQRLTPSSLLGWLVANETKSETASSDDTPRPTIKGTSP